ncbi:MAG: YheC/YheD family protein [Pseudomonadota bacterium]
MALNILVIGDPVPELKPGKETTLALINEAQTRGYHIDYCTAAELCLQNGKVLGRVREMRLTGDFESYFDLGSPEIKNLAHYDMILLRSNPDGYKRMNTFYILDALADKVFISNDPRGIREMHGKFFISNFPDFIVPYSICEHPAHFEAFLNRHSDVIVKPVNGFGGKGIVRIKEKPADIEARFNDLYAAYDHEPFILQQYIPDAAKGDKRIIMFDGKPVCSLLRVPKDADSLANVTQGATVEASSLTPREEMLCEELGAVLQDYGMFFVGVDMLGDYLTELNVISVGTVVPANQLYGIKLEETYWDMLENRYNTWTADHG